MLSFRLSDYLAPSFDTSTDWDSGKFAGLAVLPIGGSAHGGRLPGPPGYILPLDTWLTLTIRWSLGRFTYAITAPPLQTDGGASSVWEGELTALRTRLAMPPSYLRVRSLGAGAVCLRSANMTRSGAALP